MAALVVFLPFTLVGSFAVKANSISIGNTITAATVTIEVAKLC